MNRRNPTNRILIVLPFWSGDKDQAMMLARLLADIEPKHSEDADFLFVARFDCEHNLETISYVSRKFNVHTHVSRRRVTGWPGGCNAVFFGAMEWIYHKMESGQVPHYKAIFMMGADGAPFSADWISQLHQKWDEKQLTCSRPFMAGALLLDPQGIHDHINGDCALLSGDLKFLRWLVKGVCDITVPAGWDWVLAGDFKKWGWAGIREIKSVWRKSTRFSQAEWNSEIKFGTLWLHGQKDNSLLDVCRENLCKKM